MFSNPFPTQEFGFEKNGTWAYSFRHFYWCSFRPKNFKPMRGVVCGDEGVKRVVYEQWWVCNGWFRESAFWVVM